MKKKFRSLLPLNGQKGVTALLVTVVMVILLCIIALAIDYGYAVVTRNELQNVADAAALAATRQLGLIYKDMSYDEQQAYTCALASATIKPIAKDIALENRAAGKKIIINDNDIIIGQWNRKDESGTVIQWSPNFDPPDAVKVTARRDGSANGPITTFFARIFGVNATDVSTYATAALTGQSTSAPGGLPVPLGISRAWFDFYSCNQPIRFYPTNDPTSCAGWHVYDRYSNAPDSRLRDTINDLEDGSYESPATVANETSFEFTNGTMSTHTYDAMFALFESRKVLNDGVIDNDTDSSTWTTTVPVYDSGDCGSMSGSQLIVGFATIVITGVQAPPVHQIDGYVICDNVEPGRGSGNDFGTKGDIPGLVDYPNMPS